MGREPVAAWMAGDGAPVVEAAAASVRFALFGRERAARRRVWTAVREAAQTPAAIAAFAAETSHYLKLLATLACVPALPRVHVGLHRLVAVPRTIVAGRGYGALCARLSKVPSLAALDEPVRAFVFEQLLREMDLALHEAAPSPRRPVRAYEEWTCVGTDVDLLWVDPMWSGPGWGGHLFMFEYPSAGLGRKDLKALENAVAQMSTQIAGLSRVQRDSLLRNARAS